MSKTPKYAGLIESFINNKIGTVITPAEIIEAVQCTAPTVYSYIKTNSYRFEKVSAGKYRILDTVISNQMTTETN